MAQDILYIVVINQNNILLTYLNQIKYEEISTENVFFRCNYAH